MTAKSGGVNAAAAHLRVSQPSLSSQIRVLERALDLRLFHRVGRKNQLTSSGAVVYGFCRQMFEISEQMGELLSERAPVSSRRIQVGVTEEVDRPFVVEVVSQFLKERDVHERPKISIVSGSHEQLAERLRFRELDVVVTQLAMMDPDLFNLARAEVPVVLVGASQKTGKRITLRGLIADVNTHWLMPSSRFKLRAEINRFVEIHQPSGRVVFESDVIASLVRAVVDGIGVAFVPLIYVEREIREKSVDVIGPRRGHWNYRVWLACHGQHKKDSLIMAFAQAFRDVSARAV